MFELCRPLRVGVYDELRTVGGDDGAEDDGIDKEKDEDAPAPDGLQGCDDIFSFMRSLE
jgi:hypothetical protein